MMKNTAEYDIQDDIDGSQTTLFATGE